VWDDPASIMSTAPVATTVLDALEGELSPAAFAAVAEQV
jgi:hypothetical protein